MGSGFNYPWVMCTCADKEADLHFDNKPQTCFQTVAKVNLSDCHVLNRIINTVCYLSPCTQNSKNTLHHVGFCIVVFDSLFVYT
jgi:hypothetical protein